MTHEALFSQDLRRHYEIAQQKVRNFVGTLPCEGIASASEGYVAAHCSERYLLPEPTLDMAPLNKTLESDGKIAVYIHAIANPSALQFKPSQFGFGGWPCEIQIDGDRMLIRLATSGNPPPKKRHEDILAQIQANISILRNEINLSNNALRSIIPGAIADRHRHCDELIALRETL